MSVYLIYQLKDKEMTKNKKQRRLEAKAASSTPKTESTESTTAKAIKAAINGEEPKGPSKSEPIAKKKKKALLTTDEQPAKPKITGKAKDKKLDDKTAAVTAKEITDKKDLKYIYPKDATDLEKRKKFRTQCRAKMNSFKKLVLKLEASELPEDKILLEEKYKEADAFAKSVYQNPEALSI
jgi:hypothetical protein